MYFLFLTSDYWSFCLSSSPISKDLSFFNYLFNLPQKIIHLGFYLAFFIITLVASFNAKYNMGVQIAVEIELITVAGKLTNAPT